MTVGKKIVETVQHRFPKQVLPMLFHAIVMSHLDYSFLFFFKISSPFFALTRKTDELGSEERVFLFKHQVIL